jgi:hypothetical protein
MNPEALPLDEGQVVADGFTRHVMNAISKSVVFHQQNCYNGTIALDRGALKLALNQYPSLSALILQAGGIHEYCPFSQAS